MTDFLVALGLVFVIEGRSSDGKRSFRLEYAYKLGDSFDPILIPALRGPRERIH